MFYNLFYRRKLALVYPRQGFFVLNLTCAYDIIYKISAKQNLRKEDDENV
jgi:hypothetical protein